MKGKVTTIAATAMLVAQPLPALLAQTRPVQPIRPLPAPAPGGPGWERPVPLPQPVPNRPQRPPRGEGFSGRVTCESRNNRTQRCNARTQNRVELLTRSSACVRGRSWGYDQRHIWVSRNCRGTFAYGRGNNWWDDRSDDRGGLSTGTIIGGVTVAAGLAALLNNRNNSRPSSSMGNAPPPPPPPPREPEMRPLPEPEPEPESPPPPAGPFPPGPPALVVADLSTLPADSRPSMNTCLQEAARQVGVTGGTQVRFDRLVHIEPGNGGWRFRAQLIGTYPDGERILPLFCRATPTRVVELDFRT